MKTVDNKNVFVLGVDYTPSWFKDETSKGRAKVIYDDESKMEKVVIYSGTKTYKAFPGDFIMKMKSGLVVIKKDDAKRYGVTKEENRDV